MKQKMTAIDVRALCLLLKKKLVGLRLANVYDVSGRLYLLKLSKANRKEHLLIESGIRIHTTEFLRNKKDVPSGFSMKLRKHLRTKKLENLTQLGVDRVIDLQFGKGENAYHILVELYASGNVILTDYEYTILSLLRSHKFDETSKIQIREKYPFTASAGMTIDTVFVTQEDISKFIEGESTNESGAAAVEGEEAGVPQQQPEAAESGNKQNKGGKGGKQGKAKKAGGKQQDKKKDVVNLKSVLTKMVPYINFPYAEHVLKLLGHDPNLKAAIEHADLLREAALKCQQLMRDLERAEEIKGYLIYQEKPVAEKKIPLLEAESSISLPQQPVADESQETEQEKRFKGKLLKDFGPIPLAQFAKEPCLEYESFDACVDEYFSQLDKQREVTKFSSKEDEIWRKMSRIKDDQQKRIQGLQKEQDLSEFKAQLLQKYIFEVQAVIDILQVMLTSGISWNDINRMVKEEKKAANPLANLIYKINFEKNQVTLMLDACNEEDESSSEFSVDEKFTNLDPVVRVDVDLLLSAQMNIRKYFEIKKKSYEKEVKTKTAADIAIKDAEANALKELVKHRQTQKMDKMRKVFWFEKFDWFVSSENYLCISGKNAQQNEALVKKYMDKGDLFMHTDMPGAAVTIIKNPTAQIVPPITLNEAAIFEVCHSRAWEGKIVTSVYWVHADQVSKTPPTGLYIPTGSFMIRGKRSIMTPSKLELGFTLMFSLNEESIANHIGERRPRLQQDEMAEATLLQETLTEGELDLDMMELEDGEDPEEEAEGDTPSISRQISTVTTLTQRMLGDEPYSVVQVGENRELMEKKRQQAHEKKRLLKEQQGKTKDQLRADAKKKLEEKEEKEAQSKQGQKEKQVRGKQQKLRKMKEKYADQDEEERQRRLQMLGAKKTKHFDQKMSKTTQKTAKQQDGEEEKQQPVAESGEQEEEQAEEQETQVESTPLEQEEEEHKNGGVQQEEAGNDEEEKKEIEQIMKEEDINLVEAVDLAEIDKLTGVPKANDLLLAVVPMCAPYSAIQTNKFKVKIQPGTLKRGRAMKLIKSLFLAQANKNQWESTSIKNIPDPEITNMLLNNCRVLAPGLTKMQNATKQSKKKGPKGGEQ